MEKKSSENSYRFVRPNRQRRKQKQETEDKFNFKPLNSNKMKIVKVTYTTKAEYSEQNQNNIKNVMNDLKSLNHQGINYNACLSDDNKTFIHTAFFESDENQKILTELPSFLYFQEQLKSSGLEVPPKQELLSIVGSSSNIFKCQ